MKQPVQSQKKARSLKVLIQVEEGLYYPKRRNKGTDHLCSYCTVDLRLFLARLHEVHRAIAVTPVVHVPVPVPMRVRVTLALKFSRSPYLDNHSSESIHTWTIDTL